MILIHTTQSEMQMFKRQENELAAIMKNVILQEELISKSTAIVGTKKPVFKSLSILGKRISNQYCENLIPFAIRLYVSKNPHTLTSNK